MPYIPAPTARVAALQGDIDITLEAAINFTTPSYPYDAAQGMSGYPMEFPAATRRPIKATLGVIDGIQLTAITPAINTIADHAGGAFSAAFAQGAGFWENNLYILTSTSIANSERDFFSFQIGFDVTQGGTVDPIPFNINTTNLVFGDGTSQQLFTLNGGAKLLGSADNNPRIGQLGYIPTIPVSDYVTDFYVMVITPTGIDRFNAFQIVNDTSAFTSESNSPITSYDGTDNYSYHPDQNDNVHLLVKWQEQAYSFEGPFTQETFSLSLSDPTDDAIFQTFFSTYTYYYNPGDNCFILAFSDWSTSQYYFYKLSADGTQYWRINITNLPGGYDGVPSLMLDDAGNYVLTDDYFNLYFAPAPAPPAIEITSPRFYGPFKVFSNIPFSFPN